jgi:hypothetical protein
MSYKPPEHGTVADEAIEVESDSPSNDEHSRVSLIQRLEREAFETVFAASASATVATSAVATYAAASASEDTAPAITSRAPNDDMQAQVSYLERQVNRLELEARQQESPAAKASALAVSIATAPATKALPRRAGRPASKTPPSDPGQPVALGVSPELLATLDSMKKLQEDIADRIKTL